MGGITSRQRMLDAFQFNRPDRIPAVYHLSPAGLYVHGQKLLDLFNRYPPDNPVAFERVPQPGPGAFDAEGRYHEVRRDEWGILREHLIFGVHGYPVEYPFPDWAAGREYEFPPLPDEGTPDFLEERAALQPQKRDFLVFRGWISIFERLHALRPMDEVLVDLVSGDEDLLAFLDRLAAYWESAIAYYLALGADVIVFGDDWGTQAAEIVSPSLFHRVFRPRYERLMAPVKRAGARVFFHSCGCLGRIFDELLDLGIDGFWPQITLYDEATFPERCRERGVAIYIHPDRQRLIPLGTPGEIEARIAAYADRYHRLGGGGIFYVEMENDAPFENVRALIEAVDRYR